MSKSDQPLFQVFVVELDADVWSRRRQDRPNVFVGVTADEPNARFERMLASSKRHQIVREHGVCLRSDLVKNYAATTEADARRRKDKLIRKLSRQGYTVNGDTRVWNLYVVELDDGVGPLTDPRFPWVYVGETSIDPKDRFDQHARGARNGRGRLFSAVVRDHGLRLRPDLYEHLPLLYAASDAKIAERELADKLAHIGYSVKGGH